MLWVIGEEHQGDFHRSWGKKEQVEIGKGLELKRKSREDVKPQKYMRRNIKQPIVTIPRMVTQHIPFKPHNKNNLV
jgi:hypothetical protein